MTAQTRLLTVRLIQEVTASHYAIAVDALRGRRRHAKLCRPRHVAMYVASRLLPTYSLPMLGREFGRDHSSVLSAIRRVEERLGTDPETAQAVETITAAVLADADPTPHRDYAIRLAEDSADAMRRALVSMAESDPAGFVARISTLAAGGAS